MFLSDLLLVKALGDVGPELVNIEPGGIDHQVRHGADVAKMLALGRQRDFDRRVVPSGCGRRVSLKRRSRMDSAASRKITFVGSMRLTEFTIAGSDFQLRAFANVHDQGGAADLGGLPHQFRKSRNQFDRQVVHAVVAEVLESFEDGGLAGATHAGDDDQFTGRAHGRQVTFAAAFFGCDFDFFLRLGTGHLLRCYQAAPRLASCIRVAGTHSFEGRNQK